MIVTAAMTMHPWLEATRLFGLLCNQSGGSEGFQPVSAVGIVELFWKEEPAVRPVLLSTY